MNVRQYMDNATLTAQLAYNMNMTRAKVVGAGNVQSYHSGTGTDRDKPRIQIKGVAWRNAAPFEVTCWLVLRDQDALILGTAWGEDTEKWVGKNLRIAVAAHGSQYRLKIEPDTEQPKEVKK